VFECIVRENLIPTLTLRQIFDRFTNISSNDHIDQTFSVTVHRFSVQGSVPPLAAEAASVWAEL
jgi:hypothetical protein